MYNYIKVGGKDVCIVKPSNYRPSGKLIVHFHGLLFRDKEHTKEGVCEGYQFLETLEQLAPDICMIIPIGAYGQSNYSLARDYGYIAGFAPLVIAASDYLQCDITNIIVSGHSAAYRVITLLIENPDLMIDNIMLFDALYSTYIDPFNKWLINNPKGYIYNVARVGQGTDHNSDLIHGNNYYNVRSEVSDHWGLVTYYFKDFISRWVPDNLTSPT